MKNTRLDEAILTQARRRDIKLSGDRRPSDEVRTTYCISPDGRRALRTLAALLDCPANDLICIALEDLLMTYGSLPVLRTRTELRQQLAKMAGSQSSEPISNT